MSCVDLESLGNGPPDGQAPNEASAPEAAADPCSRAQPPSKPDGGDDPTELPAFVLALDVVSLDPNKVSALDLDGVCTCDTSCGAPIVVCDDDGGADNAVAHVAETASPFLAIDGIPNRLIAMGHRTVLLQIAKYNGLANDGKVVVGTLLGEGIHTQGCPTSVLDPQAQVWSRGGCGDDPWTLSPSSVLVTGTATVPLVIDSDAYVRDYQLVARFNGAAPLPFNDESTIRFGSPVLTGRLVPLDETLAPRDPARAPTEKEKRLFRIEGGVLAGRVLASDLLATLGTYTKVGGSPLCASSAFEAVRSNVCDAVDITRTPRPDPSVRCDALSAALGFVAIPAVAADVADASVTSTSCSTVDAAVLACP